MKILLPFADVPVPSGWTRVHYDGVSPVPAEAYDADVYVLPLTFAPEPVELIARLPDLRVLQVLTAGYEHLVGRIPPGVTVCGAGDIHAASVSELAVTLILTSTLDVREFLEAQQHRTWQHRSRSSLADRHVVIVGAGAIGTAIADRLRPFECRVTLVSRSTNPSIAQIGEILGSADVVVLAVPLTDSTSLLVNAEFLASMADDALLVNVARGAVVDTVALVRELRAGRLRAALDVVDPEPLPAKHELWSLPGVLITPHIGGPSEAFGPRARALVTDQIARLADGRPLVNVIDPG